MIDLYTRWGEKTRHEKVPLDDYPRPQLVRNNWCNLNGKWEYKISQSDSKPTNYDGDILVPFSPESLLSGVQKIVTPQDTLWYRRKFKVRKNADEQVLLHFGAVDQVCEVWVNETLVGKHEGGYWPFSFNITHVLREENEVIVKVKDGSDSSIHAYGKQKQKRGKIWYTPQSGIWQTVWLENVPVNYVTELELIPNFDEKKIRIKLEMNGIFEPACIKVLSDTDIIVEVMMTEPEIWIKIPDMIAWTPDSPHLYTIELSVGQDWVKSYFGMRKFSIGKNRLGHSIPLLNNEPIFYNGLLDQGYWSDGLYTPPSDDGVIYEIQLMKELGYNMLRKHIKIEPMRWYYHCDRLGMIVWQDFVNGGSPGYSQMLIRVLPYININLRDDKYKWFRRDLKKSREQFEIEVEKTVRLLKNVPSIGVWVPFNEGWGQFDSTLIGNKVRQLDPTRLVDYVSGYHDQGAGDFVSPHIYFKKYTLKQDKYARVQILSEFGGYSLPIKDHMSSEKIYGYKKFNTKAAYTSAVIELYEKEILPAIERGLAGTVYTQVSDVEDEINGLVTYDRHTLKLDKEKIIQLNERIYQIFAQLNS